MRFLILTTFMALIFVGMFFIFPHDNTVLFFLEYMLVPFILLFLMFFIYLRQGILTRISLILCGIIALSYIIFLLFYAPRIVKQIYDSPKTSNFKVRIKDYYVYARSMGNTNEMIRYAELYEKYFPNDSWDFPGFNQRLEINTKSSPDVARILHLIKFFNRDKMSTPIVQKISEKFTPFTYLNLDKRDLIQKATDYVNDSHFYAANLLLTHYVKEYGENSRTKKLYMLIQKHIENTETSYAEQSRIQLQSQIQNLYTILSKNNVNKKVINAYYQSIALGNNYPNNVQLQWLQSSYLELLTREIFFADEARVALLKSTKKIPVMFIENRESYRILWIAKDVSYINNTAYLEDIELIRIEGGKTNAKSIKSHTIRANYGTILWHIKSPYAKLVNNKLMLYSLEPGSIAHPNAPQVVSWYKNVAEPPWHINTSVDAEEIMFLHFPMSHIFLKTRSIITYLISIPLWKKYSLHAPPLYKEIFETLIGILLFIVAIYLFVKIKWQHLQDEYRPSFTYVYFWHICLGAAYSISKAYSTVFLEQALNNEYFKTYIFSTPVSTILGIVGILAVIALLNVIVNIFNKLKPLS